MEGGQFSAAFIDEDEDEAKHPEKGEVEDKITKQTQDCKHFVPQVPKQEGWVSLHDEDRVKASSLDLADNFKLEQGKPCEYKPCDHYQYYDWVLNCADQAAGLLSLY